MSLSKPNTPIPCPKGSKAFQPTGTGKLVQWARGVIILGVCGGGRSLPRNTNKMPGRFPGPRWRAASTPARRSGCFTRSPMPLADSITSEMVASLSTHVRYDPDKCALVWLYRHIGAHTGAGEIAGTPRTRRGKISHQIVRIDKHSFMAHRVIWALVHGALSKDLTIDHIDGNPQNNKLENLRAVPMWTNAENKRTVRVDSESGVQGVHHEKGRNNYRASIRVRGRAIQLGRWDTPEEAAAAYLTAKRLLHIGCTI